MNTSRLVLPNDRFPTGLPGRRVPISDAAPTVHRPWGMDHAVAPRPVEFSGKHEKPTENRTETQQTHNNADGKPDPDTKTVTVTD